MNDFEPTIEYLHAWIADALISTTPRRLARLTTGCLNMESDGMTTGEYAGVYAVMRAALECSRDDAMERLADAARMLRPHASDGDQRRAFSAAYRRLHNDCWRGQFGAPACEAWGQSVTPEGYFNVGKYLVDLVEAEFDRVRD